MNLNELPKTTAKSHKRIGRGHGSGRGGHTSTRGSKGQKSRGKMGLFFEGTKIKKSLIKRLPLIRGKGKFKTHQSALAIVNLKYLNLLPKNSEVTVQTLQAKGILAKDLPTEVKIKILGEGNLDFPLMVFLPCSKGAREKIEKAGGKVLSGNETEKKTVEAKKEEKSPKKTAKKTTKAKTKEK
ncbi:MAG: 50S ribosomal protein L15 [Patescibacteria group bacterium]|nr:50S ribosomal protein L15 [Patescibacteria group bacterium]